MYKLTENAKKVLQKRILLKNEKGEIIETIDEMFHRVAGAIAAADKNYGGDEVKSEKIFYDMMSNLEFLPNSPTLVNAGKDLGQLSACFVLPVGDSMEEIFDSVKQMALIHKSGGGTGFSFTRIRPAGSTVASTGGVASGPISFMKVFDQATDVIKQGGVRRGANMGILNVDHPDILKFIDCKEDNDKLNNFNISVGITEKFMQAVENDEDYNLVDPKTKEVIKRISARMVFEKIVDAAWKNGEPGILFIDRINAANPVPSQGSIEATNPCGEQPLLPYESCNLGSINLTKMLTSDSKDFDWKKLKKTVSNAIHFLDNVIDVNKYPLDKIDEMTKSTRKVGLGVMGWADVLLLMGIPYNSIEAIDLAEKVMRTVQTAAWEASEALAKTRGKFPLFDESIYSGSTPRRNAAVTTIAPTGTLARIAGCSSGVEPVFAYSYISNIMDQELKELNPILKAELEERGLYNAELIEAISKEGSLKNVPAIPDDIKNVFVAANDISPQYHTRMVAAFQKYTDNAVSKTVNFPNSATHAEVAEIYNLAYKLGCKGITIYRDGSREGQALNVGSVKEKTPNGQRERAETTHGITKKVKIGCGNLYITANSDEYGLCEVFTQLGKGGGCPSQSEAASRLVSIALRYGIPAEEIISQLRGIKCFSTVKKDDVHCLSCPDAVGRVIEEVLKREGKLEEKEYTGEKCPKCGAPMAHLEGCKSCTSCDFSHCGG